MSSFLSMPSMSYESAQKIPTSESILIADTIADRDALIDKLLEKIRKKHDKLAEENKKLKQTIANASYKSLSSGVTKPDGSGIDLKPVTMINKDGTMRIITTESTKRGYALCRPFESRDYPNDSDEYSATSNYTKVNIYDEINNMMKHDGDELELDGSHVVRQSYKSTIPASIALRIDDIEKVWYDYSSALRKKKFMSTLISTVTDYISSSVYVERMLSRINEIINDMNADAEFMKKIFFNRLKSNETGKIGIVFKGGNVYKLFTYILNNQLDHNIFQNYIDDVDRYFKKSDCDFGIVLIGTTSDGVERFVHLERTKENEEMINTLQFIILNKYRNEFLNTETEYEYLSMCGKNDVIMTAKMTNIMKSMMKNIIAGRIEFEREVLSNLLDILSFVNNKTPINPKNLKNIEVEFKLLDTLESDPEYKDAVDNGLNHIFNVKNAKLTDWYRLFLSYALRDGDILPKTNVFKNIVLPKEIIKKLHTISTENAEWRDIRALWSVNSVTHIAIGDNVYHNTEQSEQLTDSELYESIIKHEKFSDQSAEISTERMKQLGRVHSNRNDFSIRFKETPLYNLGDGTLVKNDIMISKTIPYSLSPEGEERSLLTPFYISINKEISGTPQSLSNTIGVENVIKNMSKFNLYGSSGDTLVDKTTNPYSRMYDRVTGKYKPLVESGKISQATNFTLSRLMVSFVVVFKTDKNTHFSLSLGAEYIDLSYTFEGDNKALIYEDINEYIPFNGTIAHREIDSLTTAYQNELLKYVETDDYRKQLLLIPRFKGVAIEFVNKYINDMRNAIKKQNKDVLMNDPIIYTKLQKIASDYSHITHSFPSIGSEQIDNMLKIIKYFTFHGKDVSIPFKLKYDTIYFPKLNGFIADLYTILFIDATYPWGDSKYTKRLQRLLFFIFVEKLQKTNIGNVVSLLNDLGIKTQLDPTDPKQKNLIVSPNRRSADSSLHEVSPSSEQINPTITKFLEEIETKSKYKPYYDIERNNEYFSYRSKYIYDSESPSIQTINSKRLVSSSCGIDKFMNSYHLLDFFPVYENESLVYRTQYLIKLNMFITGDASKSSSTRYMIVSLSKEEALDTSKEGIDHIVHLIKNAPQNLEYFTKDYVLKSTDSLNADIVLPNKTKTKRYYLLNPSSDNDFDSNLLSYISVSYQIRERLLITIYNYIYDLNMSRRGIKNIVEMNPTQMLINTYEGDINKILTVE